MTPTNEAGHGLPKLPQTEEFALRAMATNYGEGHRWDSLDRDVCRRAADEIKILRERIVALSRGVPADMVLVPREPTPEMVQAGAMTGLGIFLNKGPPATHRDADPLEITAYTAAYKSMLAAAPAAAGAQGEEYAACCDTPAYCSSVRRCTRMDSKPQPAAADGGVRERAREILAGEVASDYPKMARALVAGKSVESYVLVPHCLRAIEAALSSHRQAGEPVAFVFHELTGEVRLVWYSQNAMHNPPPSGTKLYTTPPPGPDLSKFRELAERWRDKANSWPTPTSRPTMIAFADELMALVEKGAGNG